MTKINLRFITDLGFDVAVLRKNKHIVARVTNRVNGKSTILTISRTPSDRRASKNIISVLKREIGERSEDRA